MTVPIACMTLSHSATPCACGLSVVWTVEPVTEQCPPSPIELPKVQRDPTCNQANFFERLLPNVLCRRSYVESIRAALANEQCENGNLFDVVLENCFVNKAGRYCATVESFTPYQKAIENCNDTSVCDPLCIGSLSNLKSTAGCCLYSQFNSSTESQRDFLSLEFWFGCGLTPPRRCEILLTKDPLLSEDPIPSIIPAANHASTPVKVPRFTAALFMMALALPSYY